MLDLKINKTYSFTSEEKSLVRLQPVRTLNSGKMYSLVPNVFEPMRKELWSLEFPVNMNIPENLLTSHPLK